MPALWVTPDDLRDDLGSQDPFAYEACQAASEILWSLSGRRYSGRVTVTERYELPARQPERATSLLAAPYLVNGNVVNRLLDRDDARGCTDHGHLRLSGTPIAAVTEVRVNDVALARADYWVEGTTTLALRDCAACDVEVTYTYGAPPPAAGRQAARYLAEQLVLSWTGGDCELPAHVTSVSRQGVNYTIADEQTFVQEARTGIYSVDLFLKAVNPDGARKRSRVFSPDVPRGRRVARSSAVAAAPSPFDLVVTPGKPCVWSINVAAAGVQLVTAAGYGPRGQLTSWNGATWFTADANRFTLTGGTLTCTLTAAETRGIDVVGNSTWDLYAVTQAAESTVVHVLTSNVWLTS